MDIYADELQSKTINVLRFVLSVAVVYAHFLGTPIDPAKLDYSMLSGADIFGLVRLFISFTLSAVLVPMFYLFSGYYFFYKLKEWNLSVYAKKVKSRFQTLLIPFFIWNLIALLVFRKDVFSGGFDIVIALKALWALYPMPSYHVFTGSYNLWAPVDMPLWFLRDLFIVSVFSPILYLAIKYLKVFALIILFYLYYTNTWYHLPGLNINSFFYFGLGAYFALNNLNFITASRKVKISSVLLAAIMLIIGAYYTFSKELILFFPFMFLVQMLAAFNIFSYLIEKQNFRISQLLINASFFIYATHMILILVKSQEYFRRIIPVNNTFTAVLEYVFVPLIAISFCVLLYYILNRFIPRVLAFTVGDRLIKMK